MRSLPLSILLSTTLATLPLAAPSARADEAAGASVYRQRMCQTCHGADGSGNTPTGKSLKVADLRSPEVQSKSDEELQKVVTDGKGKMPAYKTSMSAAQIREVVTYIRTLAKKP